MENSSKNLIPKSKNSAFLNPTFSFIVGKDLALLVNCNHTILSHGSYGHWAAYLAGGELYTEYGAIIPDAMNNGDD